MNLRLPVITSDAVGAAAGGLVRDGRNGLVLPAGDSVALAAAITHLATDARRRAAMGSAGAEDVLAYSHEAWAQGFSLDRRDPPVDAKALADELAAKHPLNPRADVGW